MPRSPDPVPWPTALAAGIVLGTLLFLAAIRWLQLSGAVQPFRYQGF
jgi:hypothetical protein